MDPVAFPNSPETTNPASIKTAPRNRITFRLMPRFCILPLTIPPMQKNDITIVDVQVRAPGVQMFVSGLEKVVHA